MARRHRGAGEAVERAVEQSDAAALGRVVDAESAVAVHVRECRPAPRRGAIRSPRGPSPPRRSPSGRSSAMKPSSRARAARCRGRAGRRRTRAAPSARPCPSRHSSVTSCRGPHGSSTSGARRGVEAEARQAAVEGAAARRADQRRRSTGRARSAPPPAAVHAEDRLGHLHRRLAAITLELALVGRAPGSDTCPAPSGPPPTRRGVARQLPEPGGLAAEADADMRPLLVAVADEEPVVGEAGAERLGRESSYPSPNSSVCRGAARIELGVEPVASRGAREPCAGAGPARPAAGRARGRFVAAGPGQGHGELDEEAAGRAGSQAAPTPGSAS